MKTSGERVSTHSGSGGGIRAVADPTTGRLLVIIDPNFNNTGRPYQQVGPNRINATFGQPTAWQQPRRFEAGLRMGF